jgi:hypothetical protein
MKGSGEHSRLWLFSDGWTRSPYDNARKHHSRAFQSSIGVIGFEPTTFSSRSQAGTPCDWARNHLISSILHASAHVGKPSHSPSFPRSKPRSFHRVRSNQYRSRGLRRGRRELRSTPGTDLAGREEVAGLGRVLVGEQQAPVNGKHTCFTCPRSNQLDCSDPLGAQGQCEFRVPQAQGAPPRILTASTSPESVPIRGPLSAAARI